MRLVLLAALGLGAGCIFAAWPNPAEACTCLGFRPWHLTLVEAMPDDERGAWEFGDTFLNQTGAHNYTLYRVDGYQLELE